MPNIRDGMDEARFQSGNPNDKNRPKKEIDYKKKMPTVLKNLKNGS